MDRHVLQTRASYCVPACIVMVEAWRGTLSAPPDVRQHELFTALNVDGLCSIEDAALLIPNEGVGEPNLDQTDQAVLLKQIIRAGRRAIVTCWPGRLAQALASQRPSSPYGPLPTDDVPHHSVYVFAVVDESFEIYDPWHYPAGQPFRLSRAQLVRAWTGMMLVATK